MLTQDDIAIAAGLWMYTYFGLMAVSTIGIGIHRFCRYCWREYRLHRAIAGPNGDFVVALLSATGKQSNGMPLTDFELSACAEAGAPFNTYRSNR